MLDYFIYDTSSPSCLSWSEDAKPDSPQSSERQYKTHAGSFSGKQWHIQVIEDGIRYRSTASRIIWELLKGRIPPKHYIAHLNGDSSDTRIENLVCVSHSTLQYLKAWTRNTDNVKELPSGNYTSTITIDGQKVYLGTFNTYTEAATAYRTALKQQLTLRGIPL